MTKSDGDGQEELAEVVLKGTGAGLTDPVLRLVQGRCVLDGAHRVPVDAGLARLRRGRLSNVLEFPVDGATAAFVLPRGGAAAALALLAVARLGGHRRPLSVHAFAPAASPVEQAWLAGVCGPDQPVLCFLPLGSRVTVGSTVAGDASVERRLLVTPEQIVVVAVGPAGDVRAHALAPLTVERSTGGVRLGELEVTTSRAAAASLLALAPALAATGSERSLAVCRLLAASQADPLLAGIDASLARVVRAARGALGWSADDLLALDDLPAIWEGWSLGEEAARAAVEVLRPSAPHHALPLASWLRTRGLLAAPGAVARARVDLAWAEVAAAAGRTGLVDALWGRLLELPADAELDLLPPPEDDLTTAASEGQRGDLGPRQVRVALLEALDRHTAGGDGEARLALARLQPLVPSRLEAAAALSLGPLRTRLEAARALLAPAGLASLGSEPGPVAPLSPRTLDLLRHPAARPGGVMDGLVEAIARLDVPDGEVVRRYCERLGSRSTGPLRDVVTDCLVALGTDGVEVYLSRGERSVGVRAWPGSPPFLLVGGDHLEPASPAHLGAAELRFLVGAELAHLRFGHARFTAREVRDGMWDTGRVGLDVALTLLPVVRTWKYAQAVGKALSIYEDGTVRRVLSGLRKARGAAAPSERPVEGLAAIDEELLVAHRLVQLTADRVGLLLCGDPRAAVRALFLSRPDTLAELPVAERAGLVAVLGRRRPAAEGGGMRWPDLAVRVASLVAFWLSEDWDRCQQA